MILFLGNAVVHQKFERDRSRYAFLISSTFLNFHQSSTDDNVIVCTVTGGTEWKIINPGDESEKFEL